MAVARLRAVSARSPHDRRPRPTDRHRPVARVPRGARRRQFGDGPASTTQERAGINDSGTECIRSHGCIRFLFLVDRYGE